MINTLQQNCLFRTKKGKNVVFPPPLQFLVLLLKQLGRTGKLGQGQKELLNETAWMNETTVTANKTGEKVICCDVIGVPSAAITWELCMDLKLQRILLESK